MQFGCILSPCDWLILQIESIRGWFFIEKCNVSRPQNDNGVRYSRLEIAEA